MAPRTFSYTYGVLPPKKTFNRQYDAIVGRGKLYEMELVGEDLVVFQMADGYEGVQEQFLGMYGKAGFRFDREGLYKFIEALAEIWDSPDDTYTEVTAPLAETRDNAGDFASAILTTLNIEWI